MLAHAVVTNNLANVSTTGFKADLQAFLSRPVYGDGYDSRVYATNEAPATDLAPGTLVSTGRDLDVAVEGDGWIAVQAPDGTEAYSRAGDFQLTSTGLLVNGGGHPVLGNGGPIVIPPAEKIEIGDDGSISVLPLGQAPNTLAVLDRIKLVRPAAADLAKGEDGLMHLADGATAPADAAVKLVTGALETSNVNAIGAMVDMIALARQYELQVKMMQTAEQTDAASAELLQMS
jgi:flagellar basal-body rod protein FlgF